MSAKVVPGRCVIVDYGSGNLHSAEKAFARAARAVGGEVVVSDDPEVVLGAERVVLPGVGAFADCAAGLRGEGVDAQMVDAMTEAVRVGGAPFFGVCVGMQLLATVGLERTRTEGLDWIPGEVRPIAPDDPSLKIPHMGWNALDLARPHPVTADLPDGSYAYFVHSFHFTNAPAEAVLATAEYGGPVTAMVGADNLVGTQFHPEKSQRVGQLVIEAFLRWRP